jgi:hypothetical protein
MMRRFFNLERERRLLWVTMLVGVVFGGGAFAYKVSEFVFTINSPAAKGFADVPVAVYFFVAGGWLLLLLWSFMTGKFDNLEESKFEMLRMEEEYERRGM